jgi:hypothetical protein
MILPDIFNVAEPASVKILTGTVPQEITDLYPVLQTIQVQISRKEPGAGNLVLGLSRNESGDYPVLDGDYFERFRPIRIIADFGAYTEDVIWGYIVNISPEYPKDRGTAKVTIEFQDQSIALDRSQVTRVWGDSESGNTLSDQTIARTVLSDYGFRLSSDSGQGIEHVTLNQDKTDFRFLSELAEALGYEWRLMFDEAYLGPIRLSGEAQAPILVYAGPDTSCLEFKIEEEAATPYQALTSSVDTASNELSETTLSPDLPLLGSESLREAANDSGVPDFVWRMRQEGDKPPEAAQILAQGKINEASLAIRAEAVIDSTAYGHVLLPGKLVTVDGIGQRYGGRFYVDSVEHSFDALGYTQTATLLKNGINEG